MVGDGGWIVRQNRQQRLLRILVLNPKQWVLFGRLVPCEFATWACEVRVSSTFGAISTTADADPRQSSWSSAPIRQ